jgi:hypothetical protein
MDLTPESIVESVFDSIAGHTDGMKPAHELGLIYEAMATALTAALDTMSEEQMQAFIDHPAMQVPPFDGLHTEPDEEEEKFVSFHDHDPLEDMDADLDMDADSDGDIEDD